MKYFIEIIYPGILTDTRVLGIARVPNTANLRLKGVTVTRDNVPAIGGDIPFDVRFGTPGSEVSIYDTPEDMILLEFGELAVSQVVDVPVSALDSVKWAAESVITGGSSRPTLILELEDEEVTKPQRGTVSETVLAIDHTETLPFMLDVGGKCFLAFMLEADFDSRIRLYQSEEQRAADEARAVGVLPTGEHGLIYEVVLEDGLLVYRLAPTPIGVNFQDPLSTEFPGWLENLSGDTEDITITLTRLILED